MVKSKRSRDADNAEHEPDGVEVNGVVVVVVVVFYSFTSTLQNRNTQKNGSKYSSSKPFFCKDYNCFWELGPKYDTKKLQKSKLEKTENVKVVRRETILKKKK